MKLRNLTAFLIILFLSALTAFAQQPEETPPADDQDSIKIATTLIQADVTVTDKNGNIVKDLKPEDFEIYENGKKQTITNFSFISTDTPPEKTDLRADTVSLPPVKLKAQQVRTYALVVDDLGLSFNNISLVQQSLRKFINEQMQSGDLVAIIRTGGGIGAAQSFTSDKRQLLAATDKIKWNSGGRGGIGTFTPNESSSVGTLGALNYIIRGMRDLPGRKAAILFSEGFVLSSNGASNKIFETIKSLADVANRSSVVVYTIDPRGLQDPTMANASEVVRNIFPEDPAKTRLDADPRDARNKAFKESQMSLNFLAKETGGAAFINQNNISKGLEQAVNDLSGYYLLGYQPDDETFDPKKAKFNKLEVKLTRTDLKIRYRSGFFGAADEKIKNSAQTPQQKLLNALTSPFAVTDIDLNVYLFFQNDAKNGNIIQALMYIDAKDLQFTKTNNGKQKAVFDIVALTFGDNGTQTKKLSKTYTLELDETVYQKTLEKGFVYTLAVPIKKIGAYQLRIALRDTVSDRIGSVSQFIEVPNIKKNLNLSNLVLDNFTANEWQKIKTGNNSEDSERSLLLDTTLRRYKHGTILRYDYIVYNPDQSKQIETQLRLIKDDKIVYEGDPVTVKTAGQMDLRRLQTAGAVSLGKNLEAGNYVLQVIVRDKTDDKKFATQYIEFEIVE